MRQAVYFADLFSHLTTDFDLHQCSWRLSPANLPLYLAFCTPAQLAVMV